MMAFWHWFGRSREFDAEVESHLKIAVQERVAAGEDPAAALAAARKEFGNITLTKEATRLVWWGPIGEIAIDLCQDIRYAGRLLKRSPVYAAVTIGVLALGIGANVSVFRLFQAAFLNPLPGVEDAGRLAVIVGRGASGNRTVTVSYPDYQYLREHTSSFTGLAASSPTPLSLGLGASAERVWGELVSDNYFDTLGVTAGRGRTLSSSDDPLSGGVPVVVISDGLWRRAFAADAGIVGKTVQINARPFTIVGVAEPGFHGSMVSVRYDLFLPLTTFASNEMLKSPASRWLMVLGRLRPRTTLQNASAQTAVLAAQLAAAEPLPDIGQRADVLPLWRSPFGAQTFLLPVVAVLAAMAILVLLIVCTNLANLALARGLDRRGESALRIALGASRIRIVRLLLVESLMLAVPAATLGLLLSIYSPSASPGEVASVAPSQLDISTDHIAVAFAVIVSCASTILFAFLPALRVANVPPAGVIKEESSAHGRGRTRFRGSLVALQVAGSMLLLVAAGLTLRTVSAAREADIGFDPANAVSATVDLELNGYNEGKGLIFFEQLLNRIRAAPEVESAGLAAFVPLRMVEASSRRVIPEAYERRADEDMRLAYNIVSPEYFRTMRINVINGREFLDDDLKHGALVAIVNETFARRFWGAPDNAVGKRLKIGGAAAPWRTVVGVARDIKYLTLTEAASPYFYLPLTQSYRSDMTLHVRSRGASDALIQRVRTELRALDPNLPLIEARTLAEQARVGTFLYETVATVLAVFGVMAMAMASIGIYGLVSYTVKQRTHEIGIRMALGAKRFDIANQFLSRGFRLGVMGATIGLAAALAVTRLMVAVLYGVSPTDPFALGGAAALVLGLSLAASFVPAWRAAGLNPVTTLHHH
jgi:predicted permease